jgi:hypothetical protein
MSYTLKHILVRPLVPSALLLGMLANVGCQQPDLNCTVYHGYYAAKYELTSGDETSACGMLTGDVLGLNAYYADGGGRPDLEKGSVAIRPQYVNSLIFYALERGVADLTNDEGAQAVGDFSGGRPASDDFCAVPELGSSRVEIPDVPEQLEVMDDPDTEEDETVDYAPPQAATTVTYEWSDVQVLVNADAQGTQLSAELRFEQDGCAADYHVTALYPTVACTTDEECDDDANGINPSFATRCDTSLVGPAQYYLGDSEFTGGLCVLAEEPPSYQ